MVRLNENFGSGGEQKLLLRHTASSYRPCSGFLFLFLFLVFSLTGRSFSVKSKNILWPCWSRANPGFLGFFGRQKKSLIFNFLDTWKLGPDGQKLKVEKDHLEPSRFKLLFLFSLPSSFVLRLFLFFFPKSTGFCFLLGNNHVVESVGGGSGDEE